MNMEEVIKDLPEQIGRAYELAGSHGIEARDEGYGGIYIGGMGGSAIAGDILCDYVGSRTTVPIHVVRGYTFPQPPRGKFLFIASSYSGNTEEVLALFDQAKGLGGDIYAITTGGALKARADAKRYPTIVIPPGYPPRGALGYSFVTLLYLLRAFYPGITVEDDVRRTVDLLGKLVSSYSSGTQDSPPYALAHAIRGKVPVIYTSAGMESVGVRWKGQFSENAKVLAFAGVLPEMNHNEICGWQNNPEVLKALYVIFLRNDGEHPRVRIRMEVTRELIESYAGGLSEVRARGKSLLERIYSLICMGDFVSFYLSQFLDTDPMPVEKIDALKGKLAQISHE